MKQLNATNNKNASTNAPSPIDTSLLFTNPDEESCLKAALTFVVLRRRAYQRQQKRQVYDKQSGNTTEKKRTFADDSLMSWNSCRRRKNEFSKAPQNAISPNNCHEHHMMNVAIATILPLYYNKMKEPSTSPTDPLVYKTFSKIYDYRAISADTAGHSAYAILRGIASHLRHRLHQSSESDSWFIFSIWHHLTPKTDLDTCSEVVYISTLLSTFTLLHWVASSSNEHNHHNSSQQDDLHENVSSSSVIHTSLCPIVLKIINILASLLCHLYNYREKEDNSVANESYLPRYEDDSRLREARLATRILLNHNVCKTEKDYYTHIADALTVNALTLLESLIVQQSPDTWWNILENIHKAFPPELFIPPTSLSRFYHSEDTSNQDDSNVETQKLLWHHIRLSPAGKCLLRLALYDLVQKLSSAMTTNHLLYNQGKSDL